MNSSLIPGTVFVSNPSQGLDLANTCSDADLDSTGSEILLPCREQRDRKAGEGWRSKNTVLRSTLMVQTSDRTHTLSSIQGTFCPGLCLI